MEKAIVWSFSQSCISWDEEMWCPDNYIQTTLTVKPGVEVKPSKIQNMKSWFFKPILGEKNQNK